MEVNVELIRPSPYQPRTIFDVEQLKEELVNDGLLSELVVRRKDNFFELIDGERRLRVARELGWESVPVRIVEIDDKVARRAVYKMNKIRNSYSPKEEVQYFKTMADEGMDAAQVGEALNINRNWIQAHLDILEFPEDIQDLVWSGKLTPSHFHRAKPLIREDFGQATTILRMAASEGWSRDQLVTAINEQVAQAEAARQEAAKQKASQILPEAPDMETLEGLGQGIKALQREAREKQKEAQPPEQRAAELEEKRRKAEEKKQREEEQKRQLEERIRQETLNQAFSNPELLKIAVKRAETVLPADEVRAAIDYPTSLSDKHLAEVFKAPPETWTDVIKASEKRGWTPLELAAVVDAIKDENTTHEYKAQLLQGEADPVVSKGDEPAILEDTLKRRMGEALEQDKMVSLTRVWDALSKLELFDCKEVVDALDSFYLERVVKDTPRDIEYLSHLLSLARERSEFWQEVDK